MLKYLVFSLIIFLANTQSGLAQFQAQNYLDAGPAVKACMQAQVGDAAWQDFLDQGRPSTRGKRRPFIMAYRDCTTAHTGKKVVRRFGQLSIGEQQAIGLIATDLSPRFPEGLTCPSISSPFGSPTRYDGSPRASWSNNGYHGGMDISLDVGTPLLAAADGVVIHIGTGGRLVGHVIWMQHSPTDTGLPVWTYTKYQHLDDLPALNVGDRFRAGDVVAVSGDTGTKGGHFGSLGYPHLHMNIYASPNDSYQARGHRVRVSDREYVDPVAFYRRAEINSKRLRALPPAEKLVGVGAKLQSGEIIPSNAKRVWPVYCRRK